MSSGTQIDSELKQALGSKSPSEVWQEIVGAVQAFSVNEPGLWDSEAEWWSHMEPYDALDALVDADPVKALMMFHEIHPTLDLQNLQRLDDNLLAEAALQIFSNSAGFTIKQFLTGLKHTHQTADRSRTQRSGCAARQRKLRISTKGTKVGFMARTRVLLGTMLVAAFGSVHAQAQTCTIASLKGTCFLCWRE
jgi:hypothetical protein